MSQGFFEPYVWSWFADTFAAPTPPQAASWPRIASGQNVLIFAPTGSGKTLAAFLWCISELFRMGRQQRLADSVYVLYISPLKALNNDVQKNLIEPLRGIRTYARRAGIEVPQVRSAVRTGDTSQRRRAAMSRRPPHILITTPESLYIILATSKFREALSTVRYVIVDEIHALSDNKRGVQLSLSLERLDHLVQLRSSSASEMPSLPVRVGLSATQKPLEDIAGFLAGCDDSGERRSCKIVDVGGRKDLDVRVISPVDDLLEAQYDAIWASCYDHLLSMIQSHETTLVFANSRYLTERTALRLGELSGDAPVALRAHHGSMSKRVRLEGEDLLKQGVLDALVATSSLELGIDVGHIDLVCQIQSPKSLSRGMQRIGRAGHLLDVTSKGRLLVTDRDDLVESAVLVKGILDGELDTTRVPVNSLDVLAQQIVGAVAADPWAVEDLFRLCKRSYCYRHLSHDAFCRVLDMLAGNDVLDMERVPYPKITWDKVNDMLYPEPSARLIAFRASGTIPDVEDYDVYFEAKKTRVGRLSEGFVERLHTGDIFVLGSSSWRVLGFRRNRVIVEDVYGRAPTVPFWGGERDSRTYDLGMLVGQFRGEVEAHLKDDSVRGWLQAAYQIGERGVHAIESYCREQRATTGVLPSDQRILVEHFRDELGLQRTVIHSSFGVRVNDAWAMALTSAVEERLGFRPQTATVDDGILISAGQQAEADLSGVLDWVTSDNVDRFLRRAILASPVFASRFRHVAVRALMVLREYRGRRTPVWLQSLRAHTLLEACRGDPTHPLIVETERECMHDALDVPNLRQVLHQLAQGQISVQVVTTRVPSPFAHSLLLLGQYGDPGAVPVRERRARLIHLHRALLKQILDEETLRHFLDAEAVLEVEARLQRTHPQNKARDVNALSRALIDLGDLVDEEDEDLSLRDRVVENPQPLLDELASEGRALLVPIANAEGYGWRWISTENWPLYRAAFAMPIELGEQDMTLLDLLDREGPLSSDEIELAGRTKDQLGRLVHGYHVLRLAFGATPRFVAARAWIPAHIGDQHLSRDKARVALVLRYLRSHGPVTKYEIMERYALPERWVEDVLNRLSERDDVVQGEYIATKALPQWCYRPNLERIHSLTLRRLRREMEPATPEEYADLLFHWQHLYPEAAVSGLEGLRTVLRQIQGQENYQIVYERDIFCGRVTDYAPAMLDRLCYSGEVFWRRFDAKRLRRGYIGFCFREDRDWVAPEPHGLQPDLTAWDEDIHAECDAVRGYLKELGACFFDDIVEDTGLDWRLVLRAVWHLVWTGEATNDSYESIRYADVASGLSGCYDLATRPGKEGVTLDLIVRHMLDNRRLDPRLGRWAPTERLVLPDPQSSDAEIAARAWAEQLLRRYGIVGREMLKNEPAAPPWRDVRRALARLELVGRVRRGYLVEGLSGEQYGLPEAVEALRDCRLRQPDGEDDLAGDADEMVLANMVDPANPFGTLFPLTDQAGDVVKVIALPTKYLVLRRGRPILLYEGRIQVLVDLTRDAAEQALRLLMGLVDRRPLAGALEEVAIREWNGHPIDVSPARHLLRVLGFRPVDNRWRGYVFDGTRVTDVEAIGAAEAGVPDAFPFAGKERAPVVYDAAWVISRADEQVRPKVRELLQWLEARLPPACSFVYRPRYISDLQIRYRGIQCITPHVQRRQIRLRVTHRGWTEGFLIQPDTDLDAPDFVQAFEERFTKTCAAIDALLDGG
ncbi:MAG: ATP-dependent helicase [Anaerolineae bacterium]